MPDLSSAEIDYMQKTIAKLAPGTASGLGRETAIEVLKQLGDAISERDRLAAMAQDGPARMHRREVPNKRRDARAVLRSRIDHSKD
jgi:hypothetical protein